jgi:hypothetical protein
MTAMIFFNIAIAQNDTIPNEFFGLYSGSIGHEDSGDEMFLSIGVNGDKSTIYKEIFAGNKYVTYFKINSFDKKSGILKCQSEVRINIEDDMITIEDDSSLVAELILIKKDGNIILKCEDFADTEFLKITGNAFDKMILNKRGIPVNLMN